MPVIGSDGLSPIYSPEDRWTTWALFEIWRAQEDGGVGPGQGKYVPKVNDYVVDPQTDSLWIVDHIDPVSLFPTLRLLRLNGSNNIITDEDLVYGVEAGSNVVRAYVNKSTYPYTVAIDQYVYVRGTMSSYAKLFLGTDTSAEHGEVISKMYDNSGNFISTNIPLELAAIDSHTNHATKVCKRFKTTHDLQNGERVALAFYADDGHLVWRVQLLVEITDTVQDLNTGTKFIESISLESIWLSPTEAQRLEYPLNIPMDAMNMTGVVHYTDGSTLRLPIDGGKFAMLGMEGRLSSIVGQPHDLVLRYQLSSDELAISPNGTNDQYIVRPYQIVTVNPNESISVKLFGFPFWEGDAFGYRMRWWLLNEARNVFFEATQHVRFAENTGPYDPKLYGYLQRKNVTVNLRDVSPSFISFIHTQSVDIYLAAPPEPGNPAADWTIGTEASDQYPRFGPAAYADRLSATQVNLSSGHIELSAWLTAFYRNTRPLVRINQENEAPDPTHFIVTYGNTITEWPINAWDQDLNIGSAITTKTTSSIRFIKRMVSGDLQLAFAAVPIKAIA